MIVDNIEIEFSIQDNLDDYFLTHYHTTIKFFTTFVLKYYMGGLVEKDVKKIYVDMYDDYVVIVFYKTTRTISIKFYF